MKKISEDNGILVLKMCISVGSAYNLKPQSVIDAMEKYCDNFKGGFMNVHRNSMTIGDKEISVKILYKSLEIIQKICYNRYSY